MTEEQVFLAVLDLPDRTNRIAYLDEACGDNGALRRQVEELLAAHERSGEFLNEPAAEQIAAGQDQTVALHTEGADAMADNKKTSPAPSDDDADELQFLSPPTRPDSLGRLGHYEMLQVLGKGGFGIVFRAFDDILQRVVAVKVMAPQLAATSPARRRFLREARSSAQVRHDNVVHIYEVGEQPLPYLVMEFVPGETLQQKLDRCGPLDVPETLRIGRQIAEGLSAAHACDLIHRDIKPGNILLEGEPGCVSAGSSRVKITDFGLARAADDASISQSGIIAGTPMFMAPEQALGHKIDQRADLFSLGSVLYQMASGRPPFRAPSTLAVLKRVAEEAPRPIPEIIPETPDWLCGIIAKLHAKNPADRFQSAREVADLLADCEAKLKAKQEVKNVLPTAAEKGGEGRGARGGKKWVAAAAVLLLPVIGLGVTEFAGVTHLFKRQGTPDPIQPDRDAPPVLVAKKETPVVVVKDKTPVPVTPQEPPPLAVAPFDAAQAKQHQEAWAKHLGVPVEATNKIGMKLILIPPASVVLPKAYYLGKYEVTQGEWEKVMGYNPSFFGPQNPKVAGLDASKFPVEYVSWFDSVEFCNILSEREGLKPYYELTVSKRGGKDRNQIEEAHVKILGGDGYHIPTDAEWRHGSAAGAKTKYHFGDKDEDVQEYDWFKDNSDGRTHAVGEKKPNPFGLYDLHGNVREWIERMVPNAKTGAQERDSRGGSWYYPANNGQSWQNPALRSSHTGLRVARVPSGAPSPEVQTPPVAVGPFTDADVQRIAALPAAEQVEEVRKELMRRNPGFDGKFEHKIEEGVVTEFRIVTDQLTDIAPIRVFNGLRVLTCAGSSPNKGLLADLTPLKGMNLAGLTTLDLSNTQVTDVGMVYFKDCKGLRDLSLYRTQVGDAGLAHFKNCKNLFMLQLAGTRASDAAMVHFRDCKNLWYLNLISTKVSDAGLVHMKGMPLRKLRIYNTGITDLTPLQGLPLEDIAVTPKNIIRGLDILRNMKSLKTIGIPGEQAWPAAEFWDRYDKGEFGKAAAPFTDADVQRIAALPAAQQVEEVRKELMRRNPGFDGKMETKIEDGVVTEFKIVTDQVTDIAPIRVWNALRVLDCRGGFTDHKPTGLLADLTPLEGMNLAGVTWLNLARTQMSDKGLAHFKDCKNLTHLELQLTRVSDAGIVHFQDCKALVTLSLGATKVSDVGLAHFIDCKSLTHLNLGATKVTDAALIYFKDCKTLNVLDLVGTKVSDAGLVHFKGMPLKRLLINSTAITDLTPLQGMPLEEIRLTPKNITRGLDILRDMKSLKTIGIKPDQAWPAAEFWERYDKGEFKE